MLISEVSDTATFVIFFVTIVQSNFENLLGILVPKVDFGT